MKNFYIVNYDIKQLTLLYKGESFIFDLTKGDAEMIADAFQKVWNNLETLEI